MGVWKGIDFTKMFYEFLAMTLFVYIGCGVAMATLDGQEADNSWRLQVAFAFGMSIMVLAYATAHTSGGQINSAVTLALVVAQELSWQQGLANAIGQFVGSLLGAFLLQFTLVDAIEQTTLGSNTVADGYSNMQAFLGEFIMTFLLCWVVFETAVDPRSITRVDDQKKPSMAPVAIGFAVFLAHMVLLPITGCSINPPRSFGPPIVAGFWDEGGVLGDYWIFFCAPHCAAIAAGIMQRLIHTDGEICPKRLEEEPVQLDEVETNDMLELVNNEEML